MQMSLSCVILSSVLWILVNSECTVMIDGQSVAADRRNPHTHYAYQVKSEHLLYLNITMEIKIDTYKQQDFQRFEIPNFIQHECLKADSATGTCQLNFPYRVPDLLNEIRNLERNDFLVVKSEGRDVCMLIVTTARDYKKPSFKLRWLNFGPVHKLQLVQVTGFPYPEQKHLLCNDKDTIANETSDGFLILTEQLMIYTECAVTLSNQLFSRTVHKRVYHPSTTVLQSFVTDQTAGATYSVSPSFTSLHAVVIVLCLIIVALGVSVIMLITRRAYCSNVINNIINASPHQALAPDNELRDCDDKMAEKYKPPAPKTWEFDRASVYSSDIDLVTDGRSAVRLDSSHHSAHSAVIGCSATRGGCIDEAHKSSISPEQQGTLKPQVLNEKQNC